MIVKSLDEIKSFTNTALANATEITREAVYDAINGCIIRFYTEWTPGPVKTVGHPYINNYGYQRTFQLIKSLVKGDMSGGDGNYETSIRLDFSKMNHDYTFVNGVFKKHSHWPEEKIGKVAAHGPFSHGGWEKGTKIWDDPMEILQRNARSVMKRSLTTSGLKVK